MRANKGLLKRYGKIANQWQDDAYKNIGRDDLIPIIIQLLQLENMEQDELLLDAMCGTGIVGVAIKNRLQALKKDNLVYFLDFSQKMLEQVKSEFGKYLADIRKMSFNNNSFSRIVIRGALHDIEQFSQINALQEVGRTLKSGGIFVLMGYYTSPENQNEYNYIVNLKDELSGNKGEFDRYFPTKKEYLCLLESVGFTDIKTCVEFNGKIIYENTPELQQSGNIKEWKKIILALLNNHGEKLSYLIKNNKVEFIFPGAIFTAI